MNYPDEITIQHLKQMMKRTENFFNEYGWPMRDAFGASTKNGYISGDGDYLLKNTIVDLKTSNKATMQIYWVWQLLLYHTLVFYNHFNDEKIDRLMIFNARADIVFYIDVVDIDQSVFEFVNDAAEKQSWVNEKLIKQMIGIDQLIIYGETCQFCHRFFALERLFRLKYKLTLSLLITLQQRKLEG